MYDYRWLNYVSQCNAILCGSVQKFQVCESLYYYIDYKDCRDLVDYAEDFASW